MEQEKDIVELLEVSNLDADGMTRIDACVIDRAADEIERLRTEIADLREELGEYKHNPALAEAAIRARSGHQRGKSG